MIVARMKMEFADTGWAVAQGMRGDVRKVFNRVARIDEVKMEETALETMSLGELMYFALVGAA